MVPNGRCGAPQNLLRKNVAADARIDQDQSVQSQPKHCPSFPPSCQPDRRKPKHRLEVEQEAGRRSNRGQETSCRIFHREAKQRKYLLALPERAGKEKKRSRQMGRPGMPQRGQERASLSGSHTMPGEWCNAKAPSQGAVGQNKE